MSHADLRHDALCKALEDAVLGTPGELPIEVRRHVARRAASFVQGASEEEAAPAPFAAYVDTVAQHAYRVTDEVVQGLLDQGASQDAVFEATLAAATGAARGRLQAARAPLQGMDEGATP